MAADIGGRGDCRPPLSCAGLRTYPNPRDRRCNWRFLGIIASPQDAIDAYEADPHFLGNRFAGLASAVECKNLIRLCPCRWSAPFCLSIARFTQSPDVYYVRRRNSAAFHFLTASNVGSHLAVVEENHVGAPVANVCTSAAAACPSALAKARWMAARSSKWSVAIK